MTVTLKMALQWMKVQEYTQMSRFPMLFLNPITCIFETAVSGILDKQCEEQMKLSVLKDVTTAGGSWMSKLEMKLKDANEEERKESTEDELLSNDCLKWRLYEVKAVKFLRRWSQRAILSTWCLQLVGCAAYRCPGVWFEQGRVPRCSLHALLDANS